MNDIPAGVIVLAAYAAVTLVVLAGCIIVGRQDRP